MDQYRKDDDQSKLAVDYFGPEFDRMRPIYDNYDKRF